MALLAVSRVYCSPVTPSTEAISQPAPPGRAVVEHVEGGAHQDEPHAAEERVEMGGQRQARQADGDPLGQDGRGPEAGDHAEREQPGSGRGEPPSERIDVH